jgi:hypothetical protein
LNVWLSADTKGGLGTALSEGTEVMSKQRKRKVYLYMSTRLVRGLGVMNTYSPSCLTVTSCLNELMTILVNHQTYCEQKPQADTSFRGGYTYTRNVRVAV